MDKISVRLTHMSMSMMLSENRIILFGIML